MGQGEQYRRAKLAPASRQKVSRAASLRRLQEGEAYCRRELTDCCAYDDDEASRRPNPLWFPPPRHPPPPRRYRSWANGPSVTWIRLMGRRGSCGATARSKSPRRYERVVAEAKRLLPPDDIRLVKYLLGYGDVLTLLQRFEEAEEQYRQASTILEQQSAPAVPGEGVAGGEPEPSAKSQGRSAATLPTTASTTSTTSRGAGAGPATAGVGPPVAGGCFPRRSIRARRGFSKSQPLAL